MKINILKITLILLALTGWPSCQPPLDMEDNDFFYTDTGEKVFFKVRKDKLILKCPSKEEAKALCKESMFISAYDLNCVWVIGTVDPKRTNLADLLKMPQVTDATYGLEYIDGTLQYPTDQIGIDFKDGQSVEKLLEDTGLRESVEKIELFDSYSELYLITLNAELGSILKICRNMFESELCKSAAPSFIREMKPH
jgi:hypothetical protein